MNPSQKNVQRLRETSGAGVMECKKALDEAKGDFEKALGIIRERGMMKIEKRSGRETGAGLVHSYVHNQRIGVLLDVRAETDFVVRSEPVQTLTHERAMHVAAAAPESVEELLKQPFIRDESKTVQDVVNEVIAKVGENVRINKFHRIEV